MTCLSGIGSRDTDGENQITSTIDQARSQDNINAKQSNNVIIDNLEELGNPHYFSDTIYVHYHYRMQVTHYVLTFTYTYNIFNKM